MPKRKRPLEVPVPPHFRDAIMEIAVTEDGETTSVGALVNDALTAIRKVNTVLASSALCDLVVKEVLRENKKRGEGSIKVDARGVVTISLGGVLVTDDAMPHTTAPGGSGLPSLMCLRALAEQRGVDISDLGRRKRQIMARLHFAQYGEGHSEPPARLRDEVRKGNPLPDIKLPR